MRGLAIAAGLGAATSTLLCVGFKFGVDVYFRAVSWRETRREMRSAA
jgi:hypothetical protein